jgi:hypothetical protein
MSALSSPRTTTGQLAARRAPQSSASSFQSEQTPGYRVSIPVGSIAAQTQERTMGEHALMPLSGLVHLTPTVPCPVLPSPPPMTCSAVCAPEPVLHHASQSERLCPTRNDDGPTPTPGRRSGAAWLLLPSGMVPTPSAPLLTQTLHWLCIQRCSQGRHCRGITGYARLCTHRCFLPSTVAAVAS